jgi:formate hydrogenlyase subunit 6/NADH:ubiquinone oxidoreductase subunit I
LTLWFIRGLRRGVVTTRYPARPEESAASLPTPPAFGPHALTRQLARRLAEVCPSGALLLAEDGEPGQPGTLLFDVGRCTACGRCTAEAPHATTPSGAWELAATDRCELIKKIPIMGEAR